MGYRTRLSYISKKEYNERYKNLSLEEFEQKYADQDGYFNLADPNGLKQILYVEDFSAYQKKQWDLFYKFNNHEDADIYILSKENLVQMIEVFHQDLANFYNDIYNNFEESEGMIASLIFGKRNMYNHRLERFKAYKLNDPEHNLLISNEGDYEHIMLNMTSIYQRFNWEENYLVFNGW